MRFHAGTRVVLCTLIAALASTAVGQPKQPGGNGADQPGPAQPGPKQPGAPADKAPVAELHPEAESMPAPEWIKPGLTLTWSMETAGTGKVADLKSSGKLEHKDGPRAARAAVQTYVVAVSEDRVVLVNTLWDKPGVGGGPVLAVTRVEAGAPGAPGVDGLHWVHPDALAAAVERSAKEQKALETEIAAGRMPKESQLPTTYTAGGFELGGTAYNAVSSKHFKNIQAAGGQAIGDLNIRTYDADSGVLLAAQVFETLPGSRGPGEKHSQFTLEFAGSQQVELPWRDDPLPEWVAELKRLTYKVKTTTAFEGVTMPQPEATVVMTPESRGEGYLVLEVKTKGGQDPGTQLPAGRHLIGPILPPKAADRIQVGDVLLEEPHTKLAVKVEIISPLDNGRPGYVLKSTDATSESLSVYDAQDGLLVYQRTQTRDPSGMVILREMELTERE